MSGNWIRLLAAFPILQQVQDERKPDPVAGGVSILQQVQDERKPDPVAGGVSILQQVQDERKPDPVAGGVSILQQVQDERKLIRFLLLAAIFRYRRPFPAYPAYRPFPLILNFVEGWAEKGSPPNLPIRNSYRLTALFRSS